jgi:ribose 5-phosphate isomerase B
MIDTQKKKSAIQMRIGIAADHGGFKLKEYLKKILSDADYEIIDFGDSVLKDEDDYPDFVIPLADAIANGTIERGIAVCGSGVGACIAANKVVGVRACLITEKFSAKQGVEDDNMNVICLGGRVITDSLAEELVTIFLNATFSNAERHNRRLAKVATIEKRNK